MTTTILTMDQIPEPNRKPSPEVLDAFHQALLSLFNDNVPDDSALIAAGVGFSASYCRERAEYQILQGEPHRAAYWACDTGVPNDDILATYALLFL